MAGSVPTDKAELRTLCGGGTTKAEQRPIPTSSIVSRILWQDMMKNVCCILCLSFLLFFSLEHALYTASFSLGLGSSFECLVVLMILGIVVCSVSTRTSQQIVVTWLVLAFADCLVFGSCVMCCSAATVGMPVFDWSPLTSL